MNIIYIAVILVTLSMSIIQWWFLALSAVIALAYSSFRKTGPKNKNLELLAFAKDLKESINSNGLNAALYRSIKSSTAPKEIKELSRELMLGKVAFGNPKCCEDKKTEELIEIIKISLQYGTSIENNLDMFISSLESDIESSNQTIQSSLNMDTLSSFGISFFVPLFGGIGSSIMSNSSSILGPNTNLGTAPFQAIVLAYIAIMSYIMGSFKMKNGRMALFDSFQTVLIGAGIIKASAALMAYAI